MGPEAKIDEGRAVDVIHADRFAALVVNEPALQRLSSFLEDIQRGRLGNLVAAIRQTALGNLAHALFDDRQISFSQHFWRNHVVEEAVARIVEKGRANAELSSGIQIEHRRSE